jgi:hypothetical protein
VVFDKVADWHWLQDVSWAASKKAMNDVGRFLESLVKFDKDHIPPANIAVVQPIVKDVNFTGEVLRTKSQAAAGICEWVRNVVAYDEVRLRRSRCRLPPHAYPCARGTIRSTATCSPSARRSQQRTQS